ncbi:MAG: tetratricopeptide repeat protein [Bacteroidota bacterium]
MRLSYSYLYLFIGFLFFSCNSKKQEENQAVYGADEFVGDAACISCHEEAYNDWLGSHHDWAMKLPDDTTVLGDFNNINFTADGESYYFHKDDSTYYVTTPDADGNEKTYPVAYAFGVIPLQQYLIEFPDGKYQTLRATWDTEKKEWFNQYAGQEIPHSDWLHWTQGGQRWNTMCAECHSTNLEKKYNISKDAFNTTYSIINVSCESCHGPGGAHMNWASVPLAIGDPLIQAPGYTQTEQINMCAGCHARRVKLTEVMKPDVDFEDQFIVQTINSEYYHPDGQIKEEDYVYGSFLQAEMFHQQVYCSSCHNPHSMELKFEGNKLCLQCHEPSYDTKEHHFHPMDDESALCINCHMTGDVYMGNDFRRDHSFRIPRPDQSVDYDTPNACTGCHKEESDQWAADWIVKWYGTERLDHFSDHLLVASQPPYDDKTRQQVIDFINNLNYPTLARATALEYYPIMGDNTDLELIFKSLQDSSAMVRYQALRKLHALPLDNRLSFALQHIDDKKKMVRIEAARLMSEVDLNQIDPTKRGAVMRARDEMMAMMLANADFPAGRLQLGDYYFKQNDVQRAIQEYEMALKMDSLLIPVYGNLATAYNIMGNNVMAVNSLNALIKIEPDYARAYYLRGLLLHEMGDNELAIQDLVNAIKEDPSFFRAYYNLANLYLANDQLIKAERTMLSGLQVVPDSEEGQYLLRLIKDRAK